MGHTTISHEVLTGFWPAHPMTRAWTCGQVALWDKSLNNHTDGTNSPKRTVRNLPIQNKTKFSPRPNKGQILRVQKQVNNHTDGTSTDKSCQAKFSPRPNYSAPSGTRTRVESMLHSHVQIWEASIIPLDQWRQGHAACKSEILTVYITWFCWLCCLLISTRW